MSPLCIEILIWHYSRASQYTEWHRGSAQAEIRDFLVDEGLLRDDLQSPPSFTITERGRCLVDAMCAMPLPVQKWVMP